MSKDISYQNYLGRVQQPAGWFDFAQTIIAMISQNAQHGEDLDFLCEVGMRIGALNPLPPCDTLSELAVAINTRLDSFKWGHVDIEDDCSSLILIHNFMPAATCGNDRIWQKGFAVMLTGLYHEWLRQAGSPASLELSLKDITPPSTAIFCLRKIR